MVRPAGSHHCARVYEQLAETILIADTFTCCVGFDVLLDDDGVDDDEGEDDALAGETVPVTSTRWPTCLVNSALSPSSR
jgi:hypothetical protein